MRNCFPTLPLPEEGLNRGPVEDEYELMTINEIINGKVRNQGVFVDALIHIYISLQNNAFPGLLSLVYAYLDTLDIEVGAKKKIERYLDLVRCRSNGWCNFICCRIEIHEL